MCCPFKEVGERDHSRSPLALGVYQSNLQTILCREALDHARGCAGFEIGINHLALVALEGDFDLDGFLHGLLSF